MHREFKLHSQSEAARRRTIFNTDEGREACAWADGDTPPIGDMTWLRRVFQALLHCVCSIRQLVLMLDGLDSLRPAHSALTLHWLPSTSRMPNGLVLVTSANAHAEADGDGTPMEAPLSPSMASGKLYTTLVRRGCAVVVVPRLSKTASERAVQSALQAFGKKLDPSQVRSGCDRPRLGWPVASHCAPCAHVHRCLRCCPNAKRACHCSRLWWPRNCACFETSSWCCSE